MKAYIELIKNDLRLASRDKAVIFFSYLFPLLFFFAFAELFNAGRGGEIARVVTMVLILGILGNGLFGAGMRTVHDRESHILRRFKVAPISAVPILAASIVTGLLLYLPVVVLVLSLAGFLYGMSFPDRIFSFALMVSLGLVSFRALGLILASVANSMQEANILVQLFYTPMLFLSGALFPITFLPRWVQLVSQYLPATYLVSGVQGIFLRHEGIFQHLIAVAALLITLCLAVFISAKIFRWEKEEKVPASAKLWVLAVLTPFILLGSYQLKSEDQIRHAKILYRQLQRSETTLIRDARIFLGDGKVLESGSVLVRDGKIAAVYSEPSLIPTELEARIVNAAGKTLLPGFIDAGVRLTAFGDSFLERVPRKYSEDLHRALAASLYCGITTVRGLLDSAGQSLAIRTRIDTGEWLASQPVLLGPAFCIGEGCDKKSATGNSVRPLRAPVRDWLLNLHQSRELSSELRLARERQSSGLVVILKNGSERNSRELRLIGSASRDSGLPLSVRVEGDWGLVSPPLSGLRDIQWMAFERGVPFARSPIPKDVWLAPVLGVPEGLQALERRDQSVLSRSLVQQVVEAERLARLKEVLQDGNATPGLPPLRVDPSDQLTAAKEFLLRAYRDGARLVLTSGSGNPMVFHGPGLHREMQLWVEAGIPSKVVLEAATSHAAALLGAENRIGFIKPGYEATLLLVDGNPIEDINRTERISMVMVKGEEVDRPSLFAGS